MVAQGLFEMYTIYGILILPTYLSLICVLFRIIHVIISIQGPVGGNLSLPLIPIEQLPGLRELLQP